jgi:hypothetical protein
MTAHVATTSWPTVGISDKRVTREPGIAVPSGGRKFFVGRDPVFEAALKVDESRRRTARLAGHEGVLDATECAC